MISLILLMMVQPINFEQSLVQTVENDLNKTGYEWQFHSLRNFPICDQCQTLLPCCKNLDSYGMNNWIFRKNNNTCLIGIRYKKDYDIFCFSTIEYSLKNDKWIFIEENPIVITQYGKILKDSR